MEFTLRKWQPADAVIIARHGDNPRIASNLRDGFPHPYTIADAQAFVESCIVSDETQQYCRAIVVDGEPVGNIGVFLQTDVYRKCGELGYWLAEPFWGQGIMTRAVEQVCSYVFTNYDVVRIYAEPFAENIGPPGAGKGRVSAGRHHTSGRREKRQADGLVYVCQIKRNGVIMMKASVEMALLYNFQDPERARKVKSALLCMGVRAKTVEPEDYGQPLGALAGLSGFDAAETVGADMAEEMLVLYRFTSKRLDDLLARLRKGGVGNIPYKAAITETNIGWSGVQLYQELVKEREAIQQGQSAHDQPQA